LNGRYFLSSSDSARDGMKREYLDDPGYNYEAVNRASKACGPLVKWAIAQVREVGWGC
jgi:dynein heavy chain 1